MNKQRFLAELQRLLVFMTEEDKSTVIRCYTEMFDAAGAEGEDALLSELGSPTKAAIGVSRGYEPGHIKNLPTPGSIPVSPAPAAEESRPDEVPVVDMPSFDLPPLEKAEEETSGEEKEPSGEMLPRDTDHPEPKEPSPESKPERVLPVVVGAPMFVLVMLAIGIPVAVLALAVMAALLVPGCAGLLAAFLVGVGALWCAGYMADVLLMAGCGLLVLAVGVLLLWIGVWADIRIGGAYTKGIRLLYGKLLGRKVDEDA